MVEVQFELNAEFVTYWGQDMMTKSFIYLGFYILIEILFNKCFLGVLQLSSVPQAL